MWRHIRGERLVRKQLFSSLKCLQGCSRRMYLTGNRNILKLHDRGLFKSIFPEERSHDLYRSLLGSPKCLYCGFDPTADSLHIGNLLTIMALLHCQRAGHNVIALLGSGTAQIGDPSGKKTERPAMDPATIQHNAQSITRSLERIFTHHEQYLWPFDTVLPPARILDNGEWYSQRNIVEFLSSVGRHFRMGTMLAKDSVKLRLQSPDGMSVTEFLYQVFQAYDWLHLLQNYNCTIQIGGSDQLGNIQSGFELIKRITNKTVFGMLMPLITTTTGDKLGKTEGNAVWLNSDKTSAFEFYQFFVRVEDTEVERYLKLFTFLTDEQIADIITTHKAQPSHRSAQRKLATEVTLLVHGDEGVASALRCSDAFYGGSPERLGELSEKELRDLFTSAKAIEIYFQPGTTVYDLVMQANCFDRPVDAERVIKAGGVYLNHQRVREPEYVLIPGEHILPNQTSLVRVGKKNYYLIKWLGMGL